MKRAALVASVLGVIGVPLGSVVGMSVESRAMAQPAATAPTDAEIDAALAKYKADRQSPESARAAFSGINLTNASREQIEKLQKERVLAQLTDQWGQAKARLTQLASDNSVDGVRAAELLVGISSRPRSMSPEDIKAYQEQLPVLVAQGMRHPKFLDAVKAGYGQGILSAIQMLSPAQLKEPGTLEAARAVLAADDLPVRAALAMGGLFQAVSDEEFGADRALVETIRTETIAMYGRVDTKVAGELAQADAKLAASPEDAEAKAKKAELERMRSFVVRTKNYLNGAFARGELVGHQAPDITFTWTTLGSEVTKLSDLKGKVVVLDFWATWCGPCVASFPNIRQLQARYDGYPVVILGVTSLQGFHIDYKAQDPKNRRISTEGDPSREMELMKQFIKDQEMTWAVAFGTSDVFNPEYGVQGIPHVAIVDPAGKVRFRGLHPGEDPAKEAEKIDALLQEFNLKHPDAPMQAASADKPSKN
ncbi:MAG: TlpA disulfide reductase family protein [Planctomycetota bacterium]|nr:TlpA disulfide reductase family protein [Planctomycetota bacterium]